MEQTEAQIAALKAELEDIKAKYESAETGRRFLVEHFSERLEQEAAEKAQALLTEREATAKQSVAQQFRESTVQLPDSLGAYKALPASAKVALIDKHGLGFIDRLFEKQRLQDVATKHQVQSELLARHSAKL